MFAPAAPAPLSYGPVQKYRYACCGASAAPRSTRDAHVAEPRIAYRVRLEASTAAPHQAHRPFLDEPLSVLDVHDPAALGRRVVLEADLLAADGHRLFDLLGDRVLLQPHALLGPGRGDAEVDLLLGADHLGLRLATAIVCARL